MKLGSALLTALTALAAFSVTGCISIDSSTTLPRSALTDGISVTRSLPKQLPDKSSPFPHSQFVLIAPENFLELASPIPFVADLATTGVHHTQAAAFEEKYANVHPYRIAVASLQGSPLVRDGASGFTLQPFVFLQNCTDDRYRLAYVYHVQQGEWVGRYIVHLATTYSPSEMNAPTPAVIANLNRELIAAAATLRDLLERDARGELPATGPKAKISSLDLIGVRSLGLVSPALYAPKDAEIIEEGSDHLIVRLRGDMHLPASNGGLLFGVHYLLRAQIDTLTKQ